MTFFSPSPAQGTPRRLRETWRGLCGSLFGRQRLADVGRERENQARLASTAQMMRLYQGLRDRLIAKLAKASPHDARRGAWEADLKFATANLLKLEAISQDLTGAEVDR